MTAPALFALQRPMLGSLNASAASDGGTLNVDAQTRVSPAPGVVKTTLRRINAP